MAANSLTFENPFVRGVAALVPRPDKEIASKVDIVLVIDASASMVSFWDQWKQYMTSLSAQMDIGVTKAGLTATDIRLRYIVFRDMYMLESAFLCSDFFFLPRDKIQHEGFVTSVKPYGAGGTCTSGLEALLMAMHSPWRRDTGTKHRIAVITDSAAYQLDEPIRPFDTHYNAILSEYLPDQEQEVPNKLEDLRRMWRDGVGSIDNWNSRVLLYTVSAMPWTQMVSWPRITPRQTFAENIRQLTFPELLSDILSTL